MRHEHAMTPAELAEWDRRTAPEREALDDPIWRLANLYVVLTEDGRVVHFRPHAEQQLVIWCIFVRGWRRLILPKARQLGMSALLAVIALDGLVFRAGFQGALIDKTGADAAKKMREKVRFAWERMPASIRAEFSEVRSNDSELTLVQPSDPDSPPSTFQAGINFRGGTVEFLWISEWGAIQDDDRARSREIKAGAMPAVERAANGLCVIETTWKGGLDGEPGAYVKEALAAEPESQGPKSWRILFFGWHTCPLYRQSHGTIDPVSAKYFEELARAGVELDREQQLWYAEKRRTATSAKTVKEEYPSLVHECWENLPVGSIYGLKIEQARTEGRISPFRADTRWPVHTFWDIGHPLNTVTWLMQVTPQEIRVLDVLMEMDMTLPERAAWLRSKGWDYGCHFLPWDADEANTQSIKPIDEFRRILGPSCRVVPKVKSVWDRINLTLGQFTRFVFQSETCKLGIEHLARYRAERETASGNAKDVPVHDRYSHAADAFGQAACAIQAGMIEGGNVIGSTSAPAVTSRPRVILAGSWR